MRIRNVSCALVVCLAPAVLASPAAAQTAGSGKWEIEFHGGGVSPTNPTAGTVSLPGPGEVLFSPSNVPAIGPAIHASRRQSSWYFGDGAILFNGLADTLVATGQAQFPGRITTLDPVLGRSLGTERSGGSIGARISRVLTPRLTAELSVDYSLARLQITQANSDSIEATRASFIPAFSGLLVPSGLAINVNRVLSSVTSIAALERGTRHHLLTSGALLINLRTTGDVIPYATVGASLISTVGRMPSATLAGNYQFLSVGAPMNESDSVTVRDARDAHTAAGVLGGGVKYYVSPRWGIRLDARVSLSKNTARTTLDATPNVVMGGLPAGRFLFLAPTTIMFSNSTLPVTGQGVTVVGSSTLTGPALTRVRTFSGSGVSSHTNLAAGVFWRF
jgi:hypothetical protein